MYFNQELEIANVYIGIYIFLITQNLGLKFVRHLDLHITYL